MPDPKHPLYKKEVPGIYDDWPETDSSDERPVSGLCPPSPQPAENDLDAPEA